MILRPVSPASPTGPPMTNLAGGVDQQVGVQRGGIVQPGGQFRGDHVLPEILADLVHRDLGRMLAGDEHPLHRHRHVVAVADRHLGLAVGPQVAQGSVLAYRGEPPGQPVRQRDRHRHELRGLIGGVAEHHPLVTGARAVQLVVGLLVPVLVGLVDALRDIRGLLVHGDQHRAVVAVEAAVPVVVTDRGHGVPDDPRVVQLLGRGDLARDHHHPGGDQRLAGHPGVRVVRERGVQNGIRNGVGDLVRVPLGHRFRGEQVIAGGRLAHGSGSLSE